MMGVFEERMDSILSANRVIGTVYGHDHCYQYEASADTDQYAINDIDDRCFALVALCNSKMTLKMLNF